MIRSTPAGPGPARLSRRGWFPPRATAPLAAILLASASVRSLPVAAQAPPAADPAPASPAIREPVPAAASLAPVDTEAFRRQHGTMGLFRLRLGVDAAARTAGEEAERRPCPAAPWLESAEHATYEQALAASRFHDAGRALGRWRLRSAACGGAAAQGAGGR